MSSDVCVLSTCVFAVVVRVLSTCGCCACTNVRAVVVRVLQELRETVELTDGKLDEISMPILELPTLQPILDMIQDGKPNCMLEDVLLQNGLTTSQVCTLFTAPLSSYSFNSKYMYHVSVMFCLCRLSNFSITRVLHVECYCGRVCVCVYIYM